jgi:hypothetical protein
MQSLKKLITTIALLLFLLNSNAENVSNGFIDLRQHYEFFSTPIDLNGEWDFYWQKTLNELNIQTKLYVHNGITYNNIYVYEYCVHIIAPL